MAEWPNTSELTNIPPLKKANMYTRDGIDIHLLVLA